MIARDVGRRVWHEDRECSACGTTMLIEAHDLVPVGLPSFLMAFTCPICGTEGCIEPPYIPEWMVKLSARRSDAYARIRAHRASCEAAQAEYLARPDRVDD